MSAKVESINSASKPNFIDDRNADMHDFVGKVSSVYQQINEKCAAASRFLNDVVEEGILNADLTVKNPKKSTSRNPFIKAKNSLANYHVKVINKTDKASRIAQEKVARTLQKTAGKGLGYAFAIFNLEHVGMLLGDIIAITFATITRVAILAIGNGFGHISPYVAVTVLAVAVIAAAVVGAALFVIAHPIIAVITVVALLVLGIILAKEGFTFAKIDRLENRIKHLESDSESKNQIIEDLNTKNTKLLQQKLKGKGNHSNHSSRLRSDSETDSTTNIGSVTPSSSDDDQDKALKTQKNPTTRSLSANSAFPSSENNTDNDSASESETPLTLNRSKHPNSQTKIKSRKSDSELTNKNHKTNVEAAIKQSMKRSGYRSA